jgi:hypothetical protein
LSKAALRSAFLKTRRIRVEYSHNNWYEKQGQAKGIFQVTTKTWLGDRDKQRHLEAIPL